jgi:hypothetical protein
LGLKPVRAFLFHQLAKAGQNEFAVLFTLLRGCLKSPGRSRLTVRGPGFAPAVWKLEWETKSVKYDRIGTFQTPSKKSPKIGPDDASDMKSSRLTSPTNPKLEDLISFRL